MGDGFLTTDKTIVLCTESFSKDDIHLLLNALATKYDIATGVHKRALSSGKSGLRIRISKKSIDKFIHIITPYILPEFLYKLGK